MIVIAIVSILVTLAVPAYNDYTIRAKIAECINDDTLSCRIQQHQLELHSRFNTAGERQVPAGKLPGLSNA
jgi:Tfp pilus assembly protein PilE